MCRLLGYTGPAMVMADILIKPNNSLVSQTRTGQGYHPGEQGARQEVDGDGFGVGWYPRHLQPNATRFVSVHPAWNDANLHNICAAIEADHIIAHVRAAPPGGDISPDNCHPFRCGRFLFAHNGWVGSMDKIRRRLYTDRTPDGAPLIADQYFQSICGSTDSEVCFVLALSQLSRLGKVSEESLREAVIWTIQTLVNAARTEGDTFGSKLNFVLSDGQSIVATRYVDVPGNGQGANGDPRDEPFPHYDPRHALTLYYAAAKRFWLDSEDLLQSEEPGARGAFIVSSEPLNKPIDDRSWHAIESNSLISCSADFDITVQRLEV